ncbi:hypothetical protein AcV5_007001 [Taiwanofungus camphoratus]|nr:hypothetical protein AcV5_007001 [Antrodia cinnamomea]
MSYVVKWGRERLHFPLPPPDTKLATLRHDLAAYTQLPAQSFKLIHAGAVMKDDNAPSKLRPPSSSCPPSPFSVTLFCPCPCHPHFLPPRHTAMCQLPPRARARAHAAC